jgi:hypothetical protein
MSLLIAAPADPIGGVRRPSCEINLMPRLPAIKGQIRGRDQNDS